MATTKKTPNAPKPKVVKPEVVEEVVELDDVPELELEVSVPEPEPDPVPPVDETYERLYAARLLMEHTAFEQAEARKLVDKAACCSDTTAKPGLVASAAAIYAEKASLAAAAVRNLDALKMEARR